MSMYVYMYICGEVYMCVCVCVVTCAPLLR